MRVLHIISDQNIGGAGVLLTNLLRHFDRGEVESAVAMPRGSALAERVRAIGVTVIPLRHPCDRVSLASIHEISRILAVGGFDLVHTNAALAGRITARLWQLPNLYTRHCCYPPHAVFRRLPVRMAYGMADACLSDGVIATAAAARKNLIELGTHPDRIRVVINGSEPIRAVSHEEGEAARRRYGIREGDFTVGICARLERCKGHETFLSAAAQILTRLPALRFRFLIVGEGSRRAALEAYARSLGISEFVCFTGFVKDPAPIYRLLRVNVNCSRGTETSCLALSEGMSAGVPAVATDYGGNPAMIGKGRAGILYPVGESHALADAVCRIASDPALETEMRAAALNRYQECFTAERMAREVQAFYRELLTAQIPKRRDATAK